MTKRMKWEKSQSLELGGDTRTTSTEFSFVDSFNLIITSVLFFLCARPDVPRRVQLVCTARQFLPGYNFRRGFQAGYEVETALDGPVDIAISFRQDKKRIFRLERWEKCESERLFWIESRFGERKLLRLSSAKPATINWDLSLMNSFFRLLPLVRICQRR